jgi:hypothetical protein
MKRCRKRGGPATFRACGPWPVQLRDQTSLTSEQYVTDKGWLQASLPCCPFHPGGGCGFSRHGTYSRVAPVGMRVARWYCPKAHMTFSLLPDCLSARLSGDLDEVEQVVVQVEESRSVEAAASVLRPDIDLPGAVRWVGLRKRGVQTALLALLTAMPGRLGTTPKVVAVRAELGTTRALVELREIGAPHLHSVRRPLGFQPPRARGDPRQGTHPTQNGA